VLERPQYARLQIGVLRGEKSVITGRVVGGISSVPFAEPTYLTEGFYSPFYTEVRPPSPPPLPPTPARSARSSAVWGEEGWLALLFGERSSSRCSNPPPPSRTVCYNCRITKRSTRWFARSSMKSFIPMRRRASLMGSGPARRFLIRWRKDGMSFPHRLSKLIRARREVNLHAMRLGPGKHLKGLSLFHGLVKPEEVSLILFLLDADFRLSVKPPLLV
jgi:hypothetical protein